MIQKYLAAFLTLAVTLLTAISVLPDPQITTDVALQLVLLGLGSIGTLFLPLLKGAWAGGLKTGLNIATALASALVPITAYINEGTVNQTQIIVVIVAVLNAVLVEVGVYARVDQAKLFLVKSVVAEETNTPRPINVDFAATRLITRRESLAAERRAA